MSLRYLNLACGDVYVPEWVNVDYVSNLPDVIGIDLLRPLKFSDHDFDAVYSSHFLEHIPVDDVSNFLDECYRVLKPGGCIRLVLPDFEEMARTYLNLRTRGDHARADFLILEIIDQYVRQKPGGRLGEFYNHLEKRAHDPAMISFVKERTGHDIQYKRSVPQRHFFKSYFRVSLWRKLYIHFLIYLVPKAFRKQNVSLAELGEKHAWIYDFYTVKGCLERSGFTGVTRMTAATSSIPDFPFFPLDLDSGGHPRKGRESMYIEAYKT